MQRRLALGIWFAWAAMTVQAFGWGSYGHQQVSAVALEILQSSPLKTCFAKNRKVLLRLSVTPDYDWKVVGKPPQDPELEELRREIDRHEHPLHFLDADAFVSPSGDVGDKIAALPAGKYLDVFSRYAQLLADNWSYVKKVKPKAKLADPEAPTAREVASFGTAPWRIAQLFALGKKALREGDEEMALIALGTMAHYVADMAQPYHATLIYDGEYPDSDGKGVHADFESRLLELYAKQAGDSYDKEAKLWSSFSATHDEVTESAKGKSASQIGSEAVASSVLALVGEGHAWAAPLTRAYIASKNADDEEGQGEEEMIEIEDDGHGHLDAARVPAAVLRRFGKSRVTAAGITRTVREVATRRMADGASLLARLWASAYEQAGGSSSGIGRCAAVEFPEQAVYRRYPKPTYLPF